MKAEQELVRNHVLHAQGNVVEHLLKTDESLIDYIFNLEDAEVMEWWLVTDWLSERLKEQGEVIIDDYGCCWWGRQSSGQAIYMDAVMTDIVRSLE